MPDNPVPGWRRVLESVALAVILNGLTFTGTIVTASYAAHSAYLSGLPFYQVAPYVVGVICLCFIALYYSWRWIERWQSYLTANRLKWLSDLAESDRLRINKAVRVYECGVYESKLNADSPYIDFQLSLFNGSVYHVTVEKEIKGFISFGTHTPLNGRLATMATHQLDILGPREHGVLYITLWLNEREVAMIKEAEQKRQRPTFSLDHLTVTLQGTNERDKVTAQPLELTQMSVLYTSRG